MLSKTVKIKEKSLIISLIKDDLIHTKLINGLDALGLEALDYHIHLSETIFELFGFPDNENSDIIFEFYLAELKRARRLSIRKNREAFDVLALSIYTELERRKAHAK
jgi:hypothetical protein